MAYSDKNSDGQEKKEKKPAEGLATFRAKVLNSALMTKQMKMTGRSGAQRLARIRMREALTRTGGNLHATAQLLDCTRQNVVYMIGKHEELKLLVDELNEVKLDELEDKLYQLGMEKDNVTAAIATLNAKGKHRGWGYFRNDSPGVHSRDTHFHLHVNDKFAGLDDAELARLLEQRRSALPPPEPEPKVIEGEAKVVEDDG